MSFPIDRALSRLYAIRFGKGFQYGGDAFSFIYYLARVNNIWVLIDVGFSEQKLAEKMGIHLFSVEEKIRKLIEPESISAILLTHSHWDHIDDIEKYEKAKLYLSENTFRKAVSENCESTRKSLKRAREEGRVVFLNTLDVIFDIFKFELVGGHSEDSGVFYFEYGGKLYCIAGDECFSINDIKRNIPIENAFDEKKNLQFTEKCFEKCAVILPSHDNTVMEEYPQISSNIVRVI